MSSRKKEKKKSAGENKGPKRYRSVSLTRGAWLWLAVWLAGIVFTQMLRSPASNIVFGFLTVFPFILLLYTLTSRASVRVFLTDDNKMTEKLKEFDYEFRIYNESILPYPFIEAYVVLPCSDSVRCSERPVRVSLPPLCVYNVSNTVRFRFRGTYDIGVTSFYVYDFFRIWRVRIDVNSFEKIYVLPRRLHIDEEESKTVSDSAKRMSKTPNSYEKIEISDVRDYRPGDPLKSVHWKLSSKTEELIVRDYNSGSVDSTYIFADMSSHFPSEPPLRTEEEFNHFRKKNNGPEGGEQPGAALAEPNLPVSDEAYSDMNEYLADGVVELAVASVLRELRDGKKVYLVWFDSRAEMGACCYELKTAADFDPVFPIFATAPSTDADSSVDRLTSIVGDSEDAKFVFVLPTLDDRTVGALSALPGNSGGSTDSINEAIVYHAPERYADPDAFDRYLEVSAQGLAENGIRLIKGDPATASVVYDTAEKTEKKS